jgi:hypothetical protein
VPRKPVMRTPARSSTQRLHFGGGGLLHRTQRADAEAFVQQLHHRVLFQQGRVQDREATPTDKAVAWLKWCRPPPNSKAIWPQYPFTTAWRVGRSWKLFQLAQRGVCDKSNGLGGLDAHMKVAAAAPHRNLVAPNKTVCTTKGDNVPGSQLCPASAPRSTRRPVSTAT